MSHNLIDLIDVVNLLKRYGFSQRRWKELGLTLGLHKNTLDAIAEKYSTLEDCFIECIARWLSRADNVDSRGGANWDSLSDALKYMNETAVTEKLDQESKLISLIVLVLIVCVCVFYIELFSALAVSLYNSYCLLLSQSLSDPVSVAIMLQREGVITGQVLASVESARPSVPNQREVLLAAIREAIQSKLSLLHTLCKFTGNVKLGKSLLRKYYCIVGNFGGNKFWQIWHFDSHLPN